MTDAGRFVSAGYGERAVGFGERPAMLIVDFQRAFTDPAFPMGRSSHVDCAVENTVTLASAARKRGVPVAACVVGWASERDMGRWKVGSVYRDMFNGDRGLELDSRLDGLVDFQFQKGAPSMFFGTPLITFLTRAAVDTVLICGATTSGCVRATIVDAFSYGFRVIVPEDCCGDQEEAAHRANLADVGRRYADVVSLAEALAGIGAMAAAHG